jgi:uncharacterized RDD family membrane protein YckC
MFQEKCSLETPEHVAVEFEVAGPMSRYAACLVDALVLGTALGLVVLLAVIAVAVVADMQAVGDLFGAAFLVGLALVAFGYFPAFEYFRRGQTPGKMLLGIRVMRRDMAPLDFGAVFVRNLLRVIDILPALPFPLVGMIAMTISDRALRIGDLAAGTWVVRDPEAAAKASAPVRAGRRVRAPGAEGGDAAGEPPPPGRLTPEEYRIAKEFAERRSTLDPAARKSAALRIASPILRRLGEQSLDAEAFLLEEVRRGPAGRSLL